MIIPLDKEKYLTIYRNQGLSASISALHDDMELIEFECFEGAKGYNPQIWEDLKKYREFSRELWNIELYGKEPA